MVHTASEIMIFILSYGTLGQNKIGQLETDNRSRVLLEHV